MNDKPNPNWVEAPMEQARWTVEHGVHTAREFSRFESDGNLIVLLVLKRPDGIAIGIEEARFPKVFKRKNYQGL